MKDSRMNHKPTAGLLGLPLLAAGLMALAGCERQPMPPAAAAPTLQQPDIAMEAPVGFQVQPNPDGEALQKLVASNASRLGARSDAWGLFPSEIAFERQQASERLWGATGGGFGNLHVPPVVVDPETRIEPQPYRRLAGIMVGETVAGIIVMEDGRGTFIIRPGMQIPNSPWTVVSIDRDQAVLRREGNALPKEIVVRLESPPFGSTPPNRGNQGNQGTQAPPNTGNPLGGKRGAPPGLGTGGAGGGL